MAPSFFNNFRDYWRFYWPLAALTFITIFGNQLQVMVLARYPNAVEELANIAVAVAIFYLFRNGLLFVPQLSNVYSHSTGSRRAVARFVITLSLGSTLLFGIVGWTPVGDWLIQTTFGGEKSGLSFEVIKGYCHWFTPIFVFDGLRGHYTGLLIQNRQTGAVSLSNMLSLVTIGGFMYAGYAMGFPAVMVVGASQLLSSFLTLAFVWLTYRSRYYQTEPADQNVPTWGELWRFFSPIFLSAYIFAGTRPILVAFASRVENPEALLAASRVIIDLSSFLVGPLNQMRNLYVTFGKVDMKGVRNFSMMVLLTVTTTVLIILVTPLSQIIFGKIYGLEEPVLSMVIHGVWILLFMPFTIIVRNYFHGLCMLHKRTGPIGYSGIGRIAVLALFAWGLTATGLMNQWTLPGIYVFGFAVEAGVISYQFLREKRKHSLTMF